MVDDLSGSPTRARQTEQSGPKQQHGNGFGDFGGKKHAHSQIVKY